MTLKYVSKYIKQFEKSKFKEMDSYIEVYRTLEDDAIKILYEVKKGENSGFCQIHHNIHDIEREWIAEKLKPKKK